MKFKNRKLLIYVAGALFTGLFAGWILFGNEKGDVKVKTSDPVSENTETIWTCSMHPQIRMNEPGKCPICGMTLIPLNNSHKMENMEHMAMSEEAMQLAEVATMEVSTGDNTREIELTGKVEPDERNLIIQTSHIPGRIEKLMVNFTGEYVSSGSLLAFIYSPELINAQTEIRAAQNVKDADSEYYRAAINKLKNWKLSDDQIKMLINAEDPVEQFPVLANNSGYITKKMVNQGDYVKLGEPLYEIADLSKVWILFDIYESQLPWIKQGLKVNYTISSMPGKKYTGTIGYIDPVIDPLTRVAKARIEVSNPDYSLKPEMFVSGTIKGTADKGTDKIIVPKSAVLWTGRRSLVYVRQNTGNDVVFTMREVTLGADLGNSYIIEEGLEKGEEIAVNGTFSIDAAAQIAGKPSMMNPEGGKSSMGHQHGNSGEMRDDK